MLNKRKLRVPIFLIVLLGLLTGCGARSEFSGSAPAEEAVMVEPPAAAPVSEGEAVFANGDASTVDLVLESPAAQVPETRVIIYTGNISLVVRDTNESVAAVANLAHEVGGYVSGSNIYESGGFPQGSITIRIPAGRYEETLAALRAMALRVESENSSTQDVTEEFVDLQARQENLEVTETALQELLEERQRVGSTSDILEVYRELTNIRGQIEQIEGRLRYLSNQAALSTITITLIPDSLYQPVQVAGWEPQGVAKEALQSLIYTLQGLGTVLIWLVVYGLPLLLVFLVPLVILIWIVRRVWRRYRTRRKPMPEGAKS